MGRGAEPGRQQYSRPAEALAVLGLVAGVTRAEVRWAYKQAALANHPDRGGALAECTRCGQLIVIAM